MTQATVSAAGRAGRPANADLAVPRLADQDARRPDLAICVVSWNTRDLLRSCLRSIFTQAQGVAAEVVVVDNASSDGSGEMVAREFPEATLIANGENRGFGPACNQAVAASTGRVVLFLNSDTVVLPGALATMARYLDEHPGVGAVGCALLNADGSLQRSCWRGFLSLRSALVDALYLWRLIPRSWLVQQVEVNVEQRTKAVPVDHLLGACLAVPRRVLDRVGWFDEQFFMFLEETDLCYRIKQAGYEVHYLPFAGIVHYGGASTKQVAAMRRQLYASQCRFLRKHRAARAYLVAYKSIIALAALVRVLLWTFRLVTQPDRVTAAAAIGSYARAVVELPRY